VIEASRGNRVFGWRVQQHRPAAPRGERELIAVIAVTPETEGVPKSLKKWSGRRDSNPRRPAWEAGILPLNYSRVPLFPLLDCPARISPLSRLVYTRPCNPSRTMGSDRKMDSKTDSKPEEANTHRLLLIRDPACSLPSHDNINIS
jgi:hypothetical protein